MSRSNPTENLRNPSNRWFEWRGKTGNISFYDKERPEKERNVAVKLPFSFIYLDSVSEITGYSKRHKASITSNQVRSTKLDVLDVKIRNGPQIANGLYADKKDTIKVAGGKFTTTIYLAYVSGPGQMKIGALRLRSAGLSPWMDFHRENSEKIENTHAVRIVDKKAEKNGDNDFFIPVFELVEITRPETNQQAIALDAELQKYLKSYFKKAGVQDVPHQADAREEYDQEAPPTEASNEEPPDLPPDDEPPSDDSDDVPF